MLRRWQCGNDEPIGQAAEPAVQLSVAGSVTTDVDRTKGAEPASGAVVESMCGISYSSPLYFAIAIQACPERNHR